ncbi:hypothetical protein LJB76_01485 [Clostridia bacterium OttesenSCG-928-O13]|nr:hypothetical protein [Clostridia bacterium OttesenSCG-928-O13]
MNDIIFDLVDMPEGVKGQVLPLPDGDYLVLVNSRYNFEQQREAFNHEVRHLLRNHYSDTRPVSELETEANAKDALLDKIKDAELNGLPLQAAITPTQKAPPKMAEPWYSSKENREKELLRLRRGMLTGAWY